MRAFRAKTTNVNGTVYIGPNGIGALAPGVLVRLHAEGIMDIDPAYWNQDGLSTVDASNRREMYICNSWSDSVSKEGNSKIAVIPICSPFDAYAILVASDFADFTDIDAIPIGTVFGWVNGKLSLNTDVPFMWVKAKQKLPTSSNGETEYNVLLSTVGMK